jgi:hypothetical protein
MGLSDLLSLIGSGACALQIYQINQPHGISVNLQTSCKT